MSVVDILGLSLIAFVQSNNKEIINKRNCTIYLNDSEVRPNYAVPPEPFNQCSIPQVRSLLLNFPGEMHPCKFNRME